ncbi:hypothetical protein Patl1_23770 [Pistacia atlantica]|uniref:Uncharacterized protein n=1 Tax=Pistacia atlantica TaxID=434234 RepID=A0ACC1A1D3_9ROSI|nr:hypothetical protein Patl1_23770 [Pistacia atlantica]
MAGNNQSLLMVSKAPEGRASVANLSVVKSDGSNGASSSLLKINNSSSLNEAPLSAFNESAKAKSIKGASSGELLNSRFGREKAPGSSIGAPLLGKSVVVYQGAVNGGDSVNVVRSHSTLATSNGVLSGGKKSDTRESSIGNSLKNLFTSWWNPVLYQTLFTTYTQHTQLKYKNKNYPDATFNSIPASIQHNSSK